MFTISFVIGALFFQNILAGDYSNLPGEISKQVAAQFLHRNRHSDSRCDKDEKYCESNRVSCMQHNENIREILCAKNNSCPTGQTCYLSNPCPANLSTGCTTNACYGQPCHNGGSCSMDSNTKGYSCHCQSTFDPATDCLTREKELLIAGCRVNICQNGGRCIKYSSLLRYTSSTECFCLPGFDGDNCENNINECQSSPCVHGNCTDHVNMYTCECQPGFTDVNCDTDINTCRSSPCVHGNCTDHINMYTCECHPGFTGVNCDTDVNECQCVHGNCTDDVNKYNCECQPGFTGVKCDTDINRCRSSPCINGNCTDHGNMYICECQPGFTGVNCDTDINECQCVHGNCTDDVNMYTCECQPGFTGFKCDTETTGYNSSLCVHGACQNNTTTYSCDFLYGGINCDEVNVGAIVPLVAVPVGAFALGGLGFAMWRKKIGKKNSTSPLPENQELGQSENCERNPDSVQTC